MTSWLNLFVDIVSYLYIMSSYTVIMDSLLFHLVVNLYLVCVNKRYFILGRGVLSRYGITPRIMLYCAVTGYFYILNNFVVYREPHLIGPFEYEVSAWRPLIGQTLVCDVARFSRCLSRCRENASHYRVWVRGV